MLGWKMVGELGAGAGEKYVYQVRWRVRPGMRIWHRSSWTDSFINERSALWSQGGSASSGRVRLHWRENQQPFQSTMLQLQLFAAPRRLNCIGRFVRRRVVAYAEVPFSRLMCVPREYKQSCTLGVSLHEHSTIIEGFTSPFATAELWLSFSHTVGTRHCHRRV